MPLTQIRARAVAIETAIAFVLSSLVLSAGVSLIVHSVEELGGFGACFKTLSHDTQELVTNYAELLQDGYSVYAEWDKSEYQKAVQEVVSYFAGTYNGTTFGTITPSRDDNIWSVIL